jgi:hypothetical protein
MVHRKQHFQRLEKIGVLVVGLWKAYVSSLAASSLFITDLQFHSWLRQKCSHVSCQIKLVSTRLFILSTTASSAIIQDIERISEAGSAHMAYFFFDFKDAGKQDARAFLTSVLVQLSSQSVSLCNTLLEFYSAHQRGSQRPSDSALMECLEKMLEVPRKFPLYLIVDALDECPDTSGLHSSREKVLDLVEELVGYASQIYVSLSQVAPRSTSGMFLNP